MAYSIEANCISCGACAGVCPTTCISVGETQYVINEEDCIECGACAEICPVDAPKAANS